MFARAARCHSWLASTKFDHIYTKFWMAPRAQQWEKIAELWKEMLSFSTTDLLNKHYQAKDSWDCRNDGVYRSACLEDIWLKEVGQWKRWWGLLCWCLLCPPQTCGQSIDRGGGSLSSWRPGWQQLIEKSLTPSHLPGEPGREGDHPAPGSEPAPTGAWCGLQFVDRRSCVGPGWGGQETRNAGKSAVSFPCHFLVERPRHVCLEFCYAFGSLRILAKGVSLMVPRSWAERRKPPCSSLTFTAEGKGTGDNWKPRKTGLAFERSPSLRDSKFCTLKFWSSVEPQEHIMKLWKLLSQKSIYSLLWRRVFTGNYSIELRIFDLSVHKAENTGWWAWNRGTWQFK